MKIVCLLGSPRQDGNSTTIANRFIETTASLGAEIGTFKLNQLTYRGCQGCCTCKTTLDTCVQKDDLTEVLEEIKKADVVMLSTPVYCGDIPGQVKCFIDRMYSFVPGGYVGSQKPAVPRVPPGKKVVFIITHGAPEGRLTDIPQRYENVLRRDLALAEFHLIDAGGVGPGGIPKGVPDKYLQQAEEVARAIMT